MALLSLFAPCPRGLEEPLAAELKSLGGTDVALLPGGVQFRGTIELSYRVNLWSRIASRVLLQVKRAEYQNEQDLYDLARSVRWGGWFAPDQTLRVDVTAIRSPLRSLEFATLRVKDAICDRFRDEVGRRPTVDTRFPEIRVSVFLTQDSATLYLDTSGEPLFKRGYRTDSVEAPLRENLAAGILALTGWAPEEVLFDPMCGSGTFLIEAALIAHGIAPGANRAFGFERLIGFEPRQWERLLTEAKDLRRPAAQPSIYGSDRSEQAVTATLNSLHGLGLEASVKVSKMNALHAEAPATAGILVSNPPYGVRIGEESELLTYFPQLGNTLKQRFAGWRCYFLTDAMNFPGLIRLRESRRTPLFNGAIECRLFEFRMVTGSVKKGPSPAER
ncbi:MAG: class I SAM-dependent RNA methyltransferase [Betaproteobacteria bacterium]|nr:class I SAM-dependent RNA methyltransferase [Betaproteobacteria bacterium]